MKPHITTWSGREFNFLSPEPTDILIEDIAHALSLQCRFNGHCTKFYSVAEHSVEVCKMVESMGEPVEVVMTALLHDAAEAYIGDIVSPVKKYLHDYVALERILEQAIANKFSLEFPFPEAVHRADKEVLKIEFATLQPFCEPSESRERLSPDEAEEVFLQHFRRLSLVNE